MNGVLLGKKPVRDCGEQDREGEEAGQGCGFREGLSQPDQLWCTEKFRACPTSEARAQGFCALCQSLPTAGDGKGAAGRKTGMCHRAQGQFWKGCRCECFCILLQGAFQLSPKNHLSEAPRNLCSGSESSESLDSDRSGRKGYLHKYINTHRCVYCLQVWISWGCGNDIGLRYT